MHGLNLDCMHPHVHIMHLDHKYVWHLLRNVIFLGKISCDVPQNKKNYSTSFKDDIIEVQAIEKLICGNKNYDHCDQFELRNVNIVDC